MMVVTNSALRAINFMLGGDVKLQLLDFIVHEQDFTHAVDIQDSDEELNIWKLLLCRHVTLQWVQNRLKKLVWMKVLYK